MNQLLLAVQFITRIPVGKELDYEEDKIAASMAYYPLIGTLLGTVLVLINYVGDIYLPPLVTNALLLTGMVLLTGGLHLDGLMDTCDGVFSGRKKDKILEIMRDSRVGAFGVIAVVILFLLKFSLLVESPSQYKNYILLYMPTISRWAMVYAVYFYPYARKEGLGQAYQQLKLRHLLVATSWTLLVAWFLFGLQGVLILLLSWLVTIVVAQLIINKIDALTGDAYGAINELLEVAALLIMIVVLN
ncbi:adenosylcobinamide-GDP ribazoletransferase [Halanaerobacter jeridensis]|uniref:Adenosylcobinamide-GDP ribazoletransferase n=1 Tax=Halanaerobacter jeridensis TaxID=706427 RepID=A0A938XVK9_9FIRM|nr:adenosylcobinamide-GDP ribazoletransferase [Halanaerobacter jeridensis]MBM7557111.1 adenosylcobinamide-GDP ribazoletransferase [Halanaerobacter jeridensis]